LIGNIHRDEIVEAEQICGTQQPSAHHKREPAGMLTHVSHRQLMLAPRQLRGILTRLDHHIAEAAREPSAQM
jgi:hypothetical protein